MKGMKRKLVFLYIGSFLASIIPLLCVFVFRWDNYTTTPGGTVKLCIGGIICLVFMFLKVVGKLHMPRRIVLFGVVFILVYLLKAILNDLLILSGSALLGEFLDLILFQKTIKNTKEKIAIEKTSNRTAEKIEEVLTKYVGRL